MNPLMQNLFQTIRDGLFIVSQSGQVRYANACALRLIPCPNGAPLPNPSLQKAFIEILDQRRSLPWSFEIELDTDCLIADADKVRAHIMHSPVGTDYIVLLHNLTEEQFYATAIDNLGKLIDQECRQSLNQFCTNAQQLHTELLQSRPELPEFKTHIDSVAAEGKTIIDALSKLGELARISGGEAVLNDERIDVLDFVGQSIMAMSEANKNRNVRIHLENPAQEPTPIYGSRAWLERALHELLDNACRHCASQSEVLVQVKQNANFVLIVVRNMGSTIPQHLRSRITKAFYRGKSTAQEPRFGLRLHIANKIVNLHGGNLHIDSDHGWVDFTLELPTGAPAHDLRQLDLVQAQRYAQDLAQLMARKRQAKLSPPSPQAVVEERA